MRHLINDDGKPFATEELAHLRKELEALSDEDRVQFRNDNAQAIAQHEAAEILIVSGPGTGKSTVFKQRILHWLQSDPSLRILVLSFVRKLVGDLHSDIQSATELSEKQKAQVDVFTLHRYARSVTERNHGTSDIPLQPHFRIIGQAWKHIVWDDVLSLLNERDRSVFSWKDFEKQLHNAEFEVLPRWQELKDMYFTLSKFYNAVGFADLILHARIALSDNPAINEYQLFVIDEYQDFNGAEQELIEELTDECSGSLFVGDDDQVLYETLKSGKAELIRTLYQDNEYVNGMLPFCSRSGNVHIVKTAAYFVQSELEAAAIEKIYLPIRTDAEYSRVQAIACAAPTSAVDYIRQFITSHENEINIRKQELLDGTKKDPFLLILTPARELKFYAASAAGEDLRQLVSEYQVQAQEFSTDYYKVLTYYSLADHPDNNFTFRKVIHYEEISRADTTALLEQALNDGKGLLAYSASEKWVGDVITKCQTIKMILDGPDPVEVKLKKVRAEILIADPEALGRDLTLHDINEQRLVEVEAHEEDKAELAEVESQQMSAVELMTIVGAKGLSADHVMIIGFDDVNMSRITKNAFFVAMTRARESLHLLTALKAGGSKRPHQFLSRLPEEHLEFQKHTKKDHKATTFSTRSDFLGYLNWLNNTTKKIAK